MIFQEPMTSLDPLFTVGEQIAEAVLVHQKIPKRSAMDQPCRTARQGAAAATARTARQISARLSGGMRQRVMIAMALSGEPRLLIADEPTTALDVTTEAQILDLMRSLQEEMGMAILFITHNLAVGVSEVAHEIAVMYLGKRVELGTNEQISKSPLHPYTRGLWNSIPSVDGPLKRLTPIVGTVPSARNLPSGCVFASRCTQFHARFM